MSENSSHYSTSSTPSVTSAIPAPESTTGVSDSPARVLQASRSSPSDASHTNELIRAIDRFNNRLDATIYAAIHPTSNRASIEAFPTDVPLSAVREELRGLHDTVASLTQSSNILSSLQSNVSELRRTRPRTTSTRYLERPRSRLSAMSSNASDALSSLADLHHAGQQLETASQHMRALLDDSQSILSHPSLAAEEYAGEAETNRAIKRRKIDTGVTNSGFSAFSYGHYGQVEPGKLRLEIESCDGGTLEGYGTSSATYTATNVLKNDTSVYCTKGNRCNLILKHQGATPFCLTELSIKGPPRDYTDPVQEGMVFVSMENDEALVRTAKYQIQYAAPRHRIQLASRDPNNSHIISIRHHLDSTTSGHENRSLTGSALEPGSEEWDCRLAQLPVDFTHQSPPPFNVTIECDDSDNESNQPSRRRRAADRLSGRLSGVLSGHYDLASDSDTSSDRNHRLAEEEYLHGAARLRSLDPASDPSQAPQSRTLHRALRPPRAVSDDLAEAVLAAQEATQEAVKAVGGVPYTAEAAGPSSNLMAPLAWFFIERDKSKCVIRFDPPVSGRFILLKMWSPHFSEAANIDIQSVVARGFAGPRFFPASRVR